MEKQIPYLCAGDKVMLVAPAKAIEPDLVLAAKAFWESQGFAVQIGQHCMGKHHYFSGTDDERLADMQLALDDPEVKAIVCARGGYGSVRILDRLQWSSFLMQGKWIIGFSDITVFHQRAQRYGLPSIHATMPLNYAENTPEALQTLMDAVQGKKFSIHAKAHPDNKKGRARGQLLGGNLSIVYSLLGTDDQPDYRGAILFLEDLSEQLYHLDRMFYALAKAGVFDHLSAMVLGGFTELRDVEAGFGQSFEELVKSHLSWRPFPLCFGFPAGHIPDNRALLFGKEHELIVDETGAQLTILNI